MSASPTLSTAKLPSDFERRQIFYWLKRNSSFTAWHRILGFFKQWANIAEASVKEASRLGWDKQTGVPESDYVLILKDLAHCEAGVLRRRQGDTRVFKRDVNGEFLMARTMVSYWCQLASRIDIGENEIDEAHTPYWPQFRKAVRELDEAWAECALCILEPRYVRDPAPNIFGKWLQAQLATLPFPSNLPDIPSPTQEMRVPTGQAIPFSGIWEPINAATPKRWSLFNETPAMDSPFSIAGCMNYLHGGLEAPQVILELDKGGQAIDTVWRLLWRDDRYADDTVPQEEQSYAFTAPKNVPPPITAVAGNSNVTWAVSGAQAPIAGRWLVESDMTASIKVEVGDVLPLHQGREVRWVLAD